MAPTSTYGDMVENTIVGKHIPLSKTLGGQDLSKSIDIIDIRHDVVEMNLKEEILSSLSPKKGPKTMPTLLLYDESGLQIFEGVSKSLNEIHKENSANKEKDNLLARVLSDQCRNWHLGGACDEYC